MLSETYPHSGHSWTHIGMVLRLKGAGRRSRSGLPNVLVLNISGNFSVAPQTAHLYGTSIIVVIMIHPLLHRYCYTFPSLSSFPHDGFVFLMSVCSGAAAVRIGFDTRLNPARRRVFSRIPHALGALRLLFFFCRRGKTPDARLCAVRCVWKVYLIPFQTGSSGKRHL